VRGADVIRPSGRRRPGDHRETWLTHNAEQVNLQPRRPPPTCSVSSETAVI
jgi:hypothetical protein